MDLAPPLLDHITRHILVPVVVMDHPSDTGPLGDALVGGGLPIVELTLRTPSALECLRRLAARGDLIVGAGTVVTERTVIPAGSMVMGAPGKVRRELTDADKKMIVVNAEHYVEYKEDYK